MGAISDNKLALVRKLYYKNKNSMFEISKKLKVSINSVVYFMRKHKLDRRTSKESNELVFKRKPLTFSISSKLSSYQNELKIIGIILYWGEGYKTPKASGIDFANSDVVMVQVFLSFLRIVCGVNNKKLRVLLYCYRNQKPEDLVKFWSKITKIPRNQFSKPYVRNDYKADKIGKMKYGLVHIRYADKKLLKVLLGWIEEYKNKFCVGGRAVKCSGL